MKWALMFFAALYLTWGEYLLVMNLKTARDNARLTKAAKILGYPRVAFGLLLDIFIVNFICGTVIFLEPPQELTFTSRLGRHLHRNNWRGRVARAICKHLLDPFDPDGKHCG